MAPAYGLDETDMRELTTLWLVDSTFPLVFDTRVDREAIDAELRTRAIRLVEKTGYLPLAVQAAAVIVSQHGDCKKANFDALIAHAPDPAVTGWTAALSANCLGWYRRAAERAPQAATAVAIAMLQKDDIGFVDELALYRYLSGEAALAHIAPEERNVARDYFTAEYIALLWKAGAAREGLAVLESLPSKPHAGKPELLHAGGFAVALDGRGDDLDLAFDLPLALFAAGRIDEAKAAAPMKDDGKTSLFDYLFRRTDADPYDMVEAEVKGTQDYHPRESGIGTDADCALFSSEDNADICTMDRAMTARTLSGYRGQSAEAIAAVIDGLALPGYADIRADAKRLIDDAVRRYGGIPRTETQPAFEARKLPVELAGAVSDPVPAHDRPKVELPKGFAPLGLDYRVLRYEVSGDVAVAVSASGRIAPRGYYSNGGIFVHVSHDGGRHWDKPLFTGLVDLYPYDIAPSSKMKMIAGDVLNLEVAIREIDPDTIIPPVPFEAYRRFEPGYFVTLPFSDLKRDSDGDGLTDIEEAFLLLDPAKADSDGDGLADGVDPLPNVKAGPGDAVTREARLLIFRELFGDVGITQAPLPQTEIAAPDKVAMRPSMLADIGLKRMTLVYSEADLAVFSSRIPVFDELTVRIVFNRAHDRAFVIENSGGNAGSTMLLRKENGVWRIETIRSWIS